MKAVRINEPKNVVLADIEKPTPKAGEALIKIITAGICGSDIGAFRGTNNLVSYPRIIGHELAGIIESIPEDNPKGLKVGDKVIADPYLYWSLLSVQHRTYKLLYRSSCPRCPC